MGAVDIGRAMDGHGQPGVVSNSLGLPGYSNEIISRTHLVQIVHPVVVEYGVVIFEEVRGQWIDLG